MFDCIQPPPPSTIVVILKATILGPTSGIRADSSFSVHLKEILLVPITFFLMAIQANKDNYFDTGSLAKPPRFNKDNFAFWKTKMKLFLAGSDPQILISSYFSNFGKNVGVKMHPKSSFLYFREIVEDALRS